VFTREVHEFLVGKELLNPEWAERILPWRHTGFNVHRLVRAKTSYDLRFFGLFQINKMKPFLFLLLFLMAVTCPHLVYHL
jgi:hypothetical protein